MNLSKLLFPDRCYNGGNKHNFQPIYEEKSRIEKLTQGDHTLQINRIPTRAVRDKIYVCSICQWCGTPAQHQITDDPDFEDLEMQQLPDENEDLPF